MSWLLLGILVVVLVSLAILIRPLIARDNATVTASPSELAVYRAQLDELDQDIERGAIDETQSEAARREIERRLLAAARAARKITDKSKDGGGTKPASLPLAARKRLAAGLVVGLPLASMLIYLAMGAPDLAIVPPARTQSFTVADLPPEAVEELAALTAAARPNAPQALKALGRFYIAHKLFVEAAETFAAGRAAAPEDIDMVALHGEALVYKSDGFVSQEAIDAFQAVLGLDEADARGRYYLALATRQAGRLREALDMWAALAAESSLSDPWTEPLAAQIQNAATELGLDATEFLPSAVALSLGGETAAQAAAKMPPEVRAAAIRQMVDNLAARLEQNPDDLAGWIRLARSRAVLGEMDKAVRAFAKADELETQVTIPFLVGWMQALIQSAPDPASLPADLGAVLDRVLALEPDNGNALWFAGIVAAQADETDAAIAHWRHLLEVLPEDAEIGPIVVRALTQIGAAP